MPKFRVTSPDGQTFEVNAPNGATEAEALEYAKTQFSAPKDDIPKMLPRQRATALEGRPQGAMHPGDLLAGAVRGAGSIGATLLTPFDMLAGNTKSIGNPERRANMDAAVQTMGADTNSFAYGFGKGGTEIVGTLPVGGLLSKGMTSVAPSLATKAPALLDAVSTGGMRAGGLTGAKAVGVRAAGGAATGGASAALVDPENAGTGAGIGAAAPAVLKAVGLLAHGAGKVAGAAREAVAGDSYRSASELMRALNLTPDQLPGVVAKLRGAEKLVPGSIPTAAQALSMPQASILERVVSAGPGGERLRTALVAQAEARMQSLGGVAPIAPAGYAGARSDMGESLSRSALAGDAAARARTRGLYESVPQDEAALYLPDLATTRDKFFGRGSFVDRAPADRAVQTAQALGDPAQKVSLREFDNLRKSIGIEQHAAEKAGNSTLAASLKGMRGQLDNRIDEVVRGDGAADEVLPIAWADALDAARKSKVDQVQRFRTGPQASIFRTGSDGQQVVQGGEVAAKFWGNRPGLADDVKSLRRLIDDDPALLGQFRSMVTTEGAEKAAQGGVLGQRYVDWTRNMLPGLREAFEPQQVKALQSIAADIERSAAASKLGIGPGSNTYQNASNALDAGLLDSAAVRMLTQRIPGVRAIAEPMRGALSDSAMKSKGQRLAGLLSNADEAAAALEGRQQRPIIGLLSMQLDRPVTPSGVTLRQLLDLAPYRIAPVAGAGERAR